MKDKKILKGKSWRGIPVRMEFSFEPEGLLVKIQQVVEYKWRREGKEIWEQEKIVRIDYKDMDKFIEEFKNRKS